MSVSERSVFTDAFRDYLFDVVFIDTPSPDNIDRLVSFVRQEGAAFACLIYEPLLQGAGGMLMYDAASLDRLLEETSRQGILSISDEVLTGFGRTGRLFAGEYLQHRSDIICLSKGLTGGTMALGVTATTNRIFEAFLSDDKRRTLFHGHSFTANPIACSAALASLDLLLKEDCLPHINRIAVRHRGFLDEIRQYPCVRNPRFAGHYPGLRDRSRRRWIHECHRSCHHQGGARRRHLSSSARQYRLFHAALLHYGKRNGPGV